jgi:Alginate lyase
MSKLGPVIATSVFLFALAVSAADPEPRVFSILPGSLSAAKARTAAGDAVMEPALKQLIADAGKALKLQPPTVMDKPQTPPSGDKHDYMSQAPYFWPDPAKKDGLPYIRKDGQRNPESYDGHSDAPRMGRMAVAAESLALAAWFTGQDVYADRATALLRAWFLDPGTRMNPNFNFAQAVPGVNTGRGTGMIESRSIIPAMDAASLLAGSQHWSPADQKGMEAWMAAFLDWAQTSPNGKAEAAARNNHGSFYDEQIVALALFLGQTDLAKRTLEAVKTRRIAVQIKPDGSQPLELARADSFGYSRFNVMALCNLATMGRHAGIDLWRYEAPGGGSLRKAIDFLLPYVEQPEKEWPYEHSHKGARNLTEQLWLAGFVYGDGRYMEAARKSPGAEKSREALFYPAK